MNMNWKKAAAICLLLMLILAAGCRQAVSEPMVTPAASGAHLSPAAPKDKTEPAPSAEPANAEEAPAAYAFTFSAQTLDGETVTEDFLGQYDLTMVNVWASWCPPCRGELPELGELYNKLPENVGFLSVTVDDAGDLQAAQTLLEQNHCAFPCLDGQSSPGLMQNILRQVMAIPTTLFLDRSGNEVGQRIVGVPQGSGSVSEAYMAEIEARLAQINGK